MMTALVASLGFVSMAIATGAEVQRPPLMYLLVHRREDTKLGGTDTVTAV